MADPGAAARAAELAAEAARAAGLAARVAGLAARVAGLAARVAGAAARAVGLAAGVVAEQGVDSAEHRAVGEVRRAGLRRGREGRELDRVGHDLGREGRGLDPVGHDLGREGRGLDRVGRGRDVLQGPEVVERLRVRPLRGRGHAGVLVLWVSEGVELGAARGVGSRLARGRGLVQRAAGWVAGGGGWGAGVARVYVRGRR